MAVLNKVFALSICVLFLQIDITIQKFPGTPEQDEQVTKVIIALSKLLISEDNYRSEVEDALKALLEMYQEKSPEPKIPADVHNLYYSEQDSKGDEVYGKWLYSLRDVANLFDERFKEVQIEV